MRFSPSLLLTFVAIALFYIAPAQGLHQSAPRQVITQNNRSLPTKSSWEGKYLFQEGGGRNAGGTGMFVEHTIAIYEQNGVLVADIDANGYQTSISLRCSTKIEGNRISLYFQSYREDNISEPYRKGQFLLALEQSAVGSRTRIFTYWGAYKPVFRSARNGRVYFRKTANH